MACEGRRLTWNLGVPRMILPAPPPTSLHDEPAESREQVFARIYRDVSFLGESEGVIVRPPRPLMGGVTTREHLGSPQPFSGCIISREVPAPSGGDTPPVTEQRREESVEQGDAPRGCLPFPALPPHPAQSDVPWVEGATVMKLRARGREVAQLAPRR